MTEEKYEVEFRSPTNDVDINDKPIKHYTWTAVYKAATFGQAEVKAYATLRENSDSDSYIYRISLW